MNRTKTRVIGGKTYCIYCAKLSKRDSDGSQHNNDYVEFDVCNCMGSKSAIDIKVKIDKLWMDIEDLPRIQQYKLDKMQYSIELKELRDKWNVPVDFVNPVEDK
jgi:hypothetical protein